MFTCMHMCMHMCMCMCSSWGRGIPYSISVHECGLEFSGSGRSRLDLGLPQSRGGGGAGAACVRAVSIPSMPPACWVDRHVHKWAALAGIYRVSRVRASWHLTEVQVRGRGWCAKSRGRGDRRPCSSFCPSRSVPLAAPAPALPSSPLSAAPLLAPSGGASRWPFSVALAIGAAAAWPFGAALQRPLPAAAGCRLAVRRSSFRRSIASALSVISPAHWLTHLAVSPTR